MFCLVTDSWVLFTIKSEQHGLCVKFSVQPPNLSPLCMVRTWWGLRVLLMAIHPTPTQQKVILYCFVLPIDRQIPLASHKKRSNSQLQLQAFKVLCFLIKS